MVERIRQTKKKIYAVNVLVFRFVSVESIDNNRRNTQQKAVHQQRQQHCVVTKNTQTPHRNA